MPDEIELKFIEIDKEETIQKLQALGAEKKFETEMKSITFLADGFSRADSTKKYLRLRNIEKKSYLTYKSPGTGKDVHIREEIEIEVHDFETTIKFLLALGFHPTPIFKKKRQHFKLGSTCFEIDEIDDDGKKVPPYLEIEAKTEEKLLEACKKLGLDHSKGHKGTIVEIYPDKFDI